MLDSLLDSLVSDKESGIRLIVVENDKDIRAVGETADRVIALHGEVHVLGLAGADRRNAKARKNINYHQRIESTWHTHLRSDGQT